tara:strand:+ start:174 stop:317 length:144 start_codon:yes stop_codon:yes gene_type:complete
MIERLTEEQKIEMVWKYILSLEFNEEITMNRNDDGYEIQINVNMENE